MSVRIVWLRGYWLLFTDDTGVFYCAETAQASQGEGHRFCGLALENIPSKEAVWSLV